MTMDEDEKSPMEKLEDKIFEVIESSDNNLSWKEEVEVLFNIAEICVSYHVEEKSLSERELSAYLDYQKERLLAILADFQKEKRMLTPKKKLKDFGDKKELK
jgi:hypothetical protein